MRVPVGQATEHVVAGKLGNREQACYGGLVTGILAADRVTEEGGG